MISSVLPLSLLWLALSLLCLLSVAVVRAVVGLDCGCGC